MPDICKIDRDFSPEFVFSASRSSGPGGQSVNKVSSKVELRFHIMNSTILTEEEKILLLEKLVNRITNDGELVLVSQTERSQLKNKEVVIEKFYRLLKKALTPRKKRKATRPPAKAVEKRLEEKRMRAELKEERKKRN
jgi:ribosome-associated protein